jgi:hypothetical protein
LPFFDGGTIINSFFYTDTIALLSNVDASTILFEGQDFFQYRYVLIPGGELARKPANVNIDNYLEMKKYFKLED